MPDKTLKPFVVNDETIVNCYGFRVLNAGIDYSDFDLNPVLLFDHDNSVDKVGGNWKNRRVDGSQTLMDANFDSEDPAVSVVEGKVNRGFIKGASLGLSVDFEDGTWRLAADGNLDLLKCKVKEVTVCAVPGNSGALSLYDSTTGKPLTEDQFKLTVKKLSAHDLKLNNTPKMEKPILSTAAQAVLVGLSVSDASDVAQISQAIVQLNNSLTLANNKAAELQTKLDAQVKLQAEALVDGAIADEKLLAGERAEFVEFATAHYALAAKQIGKMKGKESLSKQLHNSGGDADVKTVDDFEKLSDERKLAYKQKNPEAYNKLMAS